MQERPAVSADLQGRAAEKESQRVLEKRFWSLFGERVSEWNPCFDEDGHVRYEWNAEIGAYDMVVEDAGAEDLEALPSVDVRAPERMRLRHFLDKVLQDELADRPLDLQPVRRLVAALVKSSARHTQHHEGPPSKKHACFRGTEKSPWLVVVPGPWSWKKAPWTVRGGPNSPVTIRCAAATSRICY